MHTPSRAIFQYLTNDGTASNGVKSEMATTADKYYITLDQHEYAIIARMILYIEDDGNGKISDYGAGLALTNGVRLYVTSGGPDGPEVLDLMGGQQVQTNGEWAGMCYDMQITTPGAGNTVVAVRWTFAKAGKSLILSGHNNHTLVMETQDDLSGLLSHTAFIHGYRADTLTGKE